MQNTPIDIKKWALSLEQLVDDLYNSKFNIPDISLLEKTLLELLSANFTLWRYEDEARRKDVSDKYIAGLKRTIDIANQKRNDLIDKVDAIIKEDVDSKVTIDTKNLPINSETPGSVFDRITILALRMYNLKKELQRIDIDNAHKERCSNMLKQVNERSLDMTVCLTELLEDIYSGRKKLKSYKQHKLYNDPDLNPSLRKK
jgi:hypothetical protein